MSDGCHESGVQRCADGSVVQEVLKRSSRLHGRISAEVQTARWLRRPYSGGRHSPEIHSVQLIACSMAWGTALMSHQCYLARKTYGTLTAPHRVILQKSEREKPNTETESHPNQPHRVTVAAR